MLKRTVSITESAGVRSLVFNGSPSVEGLRTVRHRLRHWTSNPLVRVVLLRSSESGGEFFAGGDAADDESSGASGRHGAMRATQSTAHALAAFTSPTIAVLDGSARGVGAAFALHSPFGLATPASALTFDAERPLRAGASLALPQLANNVGAWLALTGATIGAADLVHSGAASHYTDSVDASEFLETFESALASIAPGDVANSSVRFALDLAAAAEAPLPATWLSDHAELVAKCFAPLAPKAKAVVAKKAAAPQKQQQQRQRQQKHPQKQQQQRAAGQGARPKSGGGSGKAAGAAGFSSSTAEAAASASAEAAVVAAAEESALQSTLVSVSAARDALRETKERLEAVQGSAEEIEWARHSLDAIASSHNGNGAAQLVNAQLLMQSSRWAADAIEMEHRVAQRSVDGALGLASESDEAAIRALFAPLEEQHSLVFHGGRQPVGSKVTEEARAATIAATAAELRTF